MACNLLCVINRTGRGTFALKVGTVFQNRPINCYIKFFMYECNIWDKCFSALKSVSILRLRNEQNIFKDTVYRCSVSAYISA